MKNIPNIITSVRLVAALLLLIGTILLPDSAQHEFLPLFVLAGISDMLDGFIARRFQWCTEFGAKLDSISDFALYISVLLFLNINAGTSIKAVALWLFAGLIIQLIHIIYSKIKNGCYPAYHTTFARICAYFIFFGVVGFWTYHATLALPSMAVCWILCSIEGIIITSILQAPHSNLDGIWSAIQLTRHTR